jgi:hypothetical protein
MLSKRRESLKGTASARTRVLNRSRIPPSLTTSTLTPSSSSRSAINPPWSNNDRFSSNRTRMSTSEASVFSPRATDPKSRISCAPYRRAISMIASRLCRRIFRVIVIGQLYIGIIPHRGRSIGTLPPRPCPPCHSCDNPIKSRGRQRNHKTSYHPEGWRPRISGGQADAARLR